MPIVSSKNQYRGINAHFQGYAQNAPDGWSPFHATHIIRLTDLLTSILPKGYRAIPERSLQLRIHDKDTGRDSIQYPRPDISIQNPKRSPSFSTPRGEVAFATPIAVIDVGENYKNPLPEPYDLSAVVIKKEGDEVARIEILSPTNKKGEARDEYLEKRANALKADIVLVEVDYLPQTATLIPDMPTYGQPNAFPYTINVIDPRWQPDQPNGKNEIYGFGVDEPMSPIKIPLLRDDSIAVDFGEAYNRTFNSLPAFSDEVDYSRNPLGFERLTAADQVKIGARMLAIADAKREGVNLDEIDPPLPPKIDDPALQHLQSIAAKRASLWIDDQNFDACWVLSTADTGQTLVLIHRSPNGKYDQLDLVLGNANTVEAAYRGLEQTLEQGGVESLIEHAKKLATSTI